MDFCDDDPLCSSKEGRSAEPTWGLRRSRVVGGNWIKRWRAARETVSNEAPNRGCVSAAPAILANVQSDSSALRRGTLGGSHLTSASTINPAALCALFVPRVEEKMGREGGGADLNPGFSPEGFLWVSPPRPSPPPPPQPSAHLASGGKKNKKNKVPRPISGEGPSRVSTGGGGRSLLETFCRLM